MQIEVTLGTTDEDDGFNVTTSLTHDGDLSPEAARDFLRACSDEALRTFVEACAVGDKQP